MVDEDTREKLAEKTRVHLLRLSVDYDTILEFTKWAKELRRWPQIIVEELSEALHHVPPAQNLALWYALDSIVNDVRKPYARHFGPLLSDMIQQSMPMSDPETEKAYARLLRTWRGKSLQGVCPAMLPLAPSSLPSCNPHFAPLLLHAP